MKSGYFYHKFGFQRNSEDKNSAPGAPFRLRSVLPVLIPSLPVLSAVYNIGHGSELQIHHIFFSLSLPNTAEPNQTAILPAWEITLAATSINPRLTVTA